MLWEQLFAYYRTFGRVATRRMLTPPRSVIEKVCKRTGADVKEAINEREEMVEELMEFIDACTDKDFVDPETGEGE